MGRWGRLLAPLFLEFAGILDGWRVLYVGSGTSSLPIEIATQRPHCQIVGIEPREDYVAYAKAQGPNTAVRFEVGNAQELPLADAEFAASLSLLLFNFIPHLRKALAELQRVSRPSGQICAATWDYGDWMQMLRMFWDAATKLDANAAQIDEKNILLCRCGELSTLWREGGLETSRSRVQCNSDRCTIFGNLSLLVKVRPEPRRATDTCAQDRTA
jgi:SAM-dependent methyltransferase